MKHLLLACSLVCSGIAAQSPITTGVQPGSTAFIGGLQWVVANPPPMTMYFDVQIANPAGLTITQIDVNTNTGAGTNGTLAVHVTPNGVSHQGNQTNAAVWTLMATQSRTHTGGRVTFQLPTPFWLAPGTYGVALHHVGCNPIYTNPATPVPPLAPLYTNADLTVDMTAARARPSDLTNAFGGTSNGTSPRHANVALHYLVGAVAVDFAATPTRGASPLPVQFTSYATSGNPGGVLAWLWDFDNDGVTDSQLQNPLHTYTNCGDYSVTLTIVDSTGTYSTTKTNFVRTDVVVPSFTNTIVAPGVVQFTDTSSPVPQTWAWDLDGDGLVDSTAPNPTFAYAAACGEANVTLTVTLACQPAVVLQKRIAVASSLETTFQSGLVINQTVPGGTSFLDLVVTNPIGVTICGLHCNSNVPNGGAVTVNVHQKDGSYQGFVDNAAVWRLAGSANATSRGPGQRTFAAFPAPIHLATGSHALAIEHLGASPIYTNLGGAQTYTNADLSLTTGLVQAPPIFGPAATSTQYTPRVWNGALHYGTSSGNGAAGYGYFGAGCVGTLGIPSNTAASQPRLGTTAALVVDRLALNAAFFLFGFSRTTSTLGPLPLDLAPFGAPGCPARVSPDATNLIFGSANAATLNFTIPNALSLVGVQFFTQALSLDPTVNTLGGVLSDAAAMVIGS
jgi:PKD repeat protein